VPLDSLECEQRCFDGGPLAIGAILGVLFVVGGGGRLWITWNAR